jgi:hypothetical protein
MKDSDLLKAAALRYRTFFLWDRTSHPEPTLLELIRKMGMRFKTTDKHRCVVIRERIFWIGS